MQKDRDLESFSAVCLDAHKHMCLVAYRPGCIIDVVWVERNYTDCMQEFWEGNYKCCIK